MPLQSLTARHPLGFLAQPAISSGMPTITALGDALSAFEGGKKLVGLSLRTKIVGFPV
jgi:hypothetical protein